MSWNRADEKLKRDTEKSKPGPGGAQTRGKRKSVKTETLSATGAPDRARPGELVAGSTDRQMKNTRRETKMLGALGLSVSGQKLGRRR
jgi:hypothetical protein